MTTNITLPPLPYPYNTPQYRTVGEVIKAYAVETVETNRELEEVTLERFLNTFYKIAEFLGIDYEEARKAEGKPSDVYIKAIEERTREAVEEFKEGISACCGRYECGGECGNDWVWR